jgi:Na+/H+ antiporter NhaD/arsenite permease-like protein
MILPVIVLSLVFLLTITRQIGNIRLDLWQIMGLGALAVLLTGQISVPEAIEAINMDVLLFLFGVFAIGQALESSGYLSVVSYNFFKNAKNMDAIILYVLFGMGFASAFLMNDTLAIIGTPVVLLLARQHQIDPKVLLLALAFAVTTGSVTSPIGNPQNLLIALNGSIENPFVVFARYLLLPTILNLTAAYLVLKLFFREHFSTTVLNHSQPQVSDDKLASLSRISLILLIALVCVKILIQLLAIPFDFRLTYIALIAAIPVLVLNSQRYELVKRMDWHTLFFFAAMFVLMESVWDSGFFQGFLADTKQSVVSIPMVLSVSVILSQFISNVPLVALYLPILSHASVDTGGLLALAAGSTIAGNLSVLGAASNVIIIHNAEKKGNVTLTFIEFFKIGVPLTIIQTGIYCLFLSL